MSKRKKINQTRAPFHMLCKPIGPLCNLRCTHCFYLEKNRLYPDEEHWCMPEKVLDRFTKLYIHSQPEGTQEVQFAWQGGEPTMLGVDFFRHALELQQKYVRPRMRIGNALQTNATLIDDEWAAFLAENDFLVGFSIDGPQRLHDRYRLDAKGEGSFAPAMRALEAMKRHKVEFNTLTCVQNENAESPEEIYRFLRDEVGTTFMQFIPIVEPGTDGGLSAETVSGEQWGKFLCGVFDTWLHEDVGKVFVQHFDMLLGIVAGYPSSLCVHSPVCGRALAVEHNGDVYSCDHFVTPEHRLGNVLADTLAYTVDGEFQTRFGRAKSESLPKQCRECKYLRLCYGGCPCNRLATTADGEPGLNAVCAGYRMFYEHALPVLQAMAAALRQRRPASDWMHVMTG